MTIRQKPLTAEEFYRLPDDGNRYELLAGSLVSEPNPSFDHGRVVIRLGRLLDTFVQSRCLGVVTGDDAGFQGPSLRRSWAISPPELGSSGP